MYLKVKEEPGSSVFLHLRDNHYWIDNGHWGCDITRKDGVIKISKCGAPHLIGYELIPATKAEYIQSAGKYASDDGLNGFDESMIHQLEDILTRLPKEEILLIINAYRNGVLSV